MAVTRASGLNFGRTATGKAPPTPIKAFSGFVVRRRRSGGNLREGLSFVLPCELRNCGLQGSRVQLLYLTGHDLNWAQIAFEVWLHRATDVAMISPVLFAGDVVPVVTMPAVGTALAIGVILVAPGRRVDRFFLVGNDLG